jgi:hypothetical protein
MGMVSARVTKRLAEVTTARIHAAVRVATMALMRSTDHVSAELVFQDLHAPFTSNFTIIPG